MNEENQEDISLELRKFNFAALTITPLWLLRNGFIVTLLIYLILVAFFPPSFLFINIIFFVKGNKWSWGDGSRWNNFNEFCEKQIVWNQIAIILFIVQIVGLLFYFKVI